MVGYCDLQTDLIAEHRYEPRYFSIHKQKLWLINHFDRYYMGKNPNWSKFMQIDLFWSSKRTLIKTAKIQSISRAKEKLQWHCLLNRPSCQLSCGSATEEFSTNSPGFPCDPRKNLRPISLSFKLGHCLMFLSLIDSSGCPDRQLTIFQCGLHTFSVFCLFNWRR